MNKKNESKMRRVLIITLILCVTFSCKVFANNQIDASFNNLYPTPFSKTTLGKATLLAGSAIFVGAVTYVSAGTGTVAAGGAVSTWIGTQIGVIAGYSGIAATNYGLAVLGGGAVSSGGLGVLGGISVINALGDATLTFALDKAESKMSKPYEKYSMIKMNIPKKGEKEALAILAKLDDTIKLFNKNNVDSSFFKITTDKYHRDALQVLDNTDADSNESGYNYILKAIVQFNMMHYDDCEISLSKAEPYVNNKSVVEYMKSLLSLVNGDYVSAKSSIAKSIAMEKNEVKPYILYTQILTDTDNNTEAIQIAKDGLNNADDDNFTLSLLAGNISYYKLKNYDESIKYYKNALSNITTDEFEAECKLMIAKSYRKKSDMKEAKSWLKSALNEVAKNPEYSRTIQQSWDNES